MPGTEISVVIPTYNEEDTLAPTVRHLIDHVDHPEKLEIIVADGGSKDRTEQEANSLPVRFFSCSRKGRAAQMNQGAEQASSPILYFLHADTLVPDHWDTTIISAFRGGHKAGCFQLKFDDNHHLLSAYAWFTRFQLKMFRFGDQSLFIDRELFEFSGGYLEDHIVMEDNEFIWRIYNTAGFHILDECVITSARRYHDNGIIRLQFVFGLIYFGYQLGLSQKQLVGIYKRFIG